MPASNPSPPGPASATAAGLVNLAAQTFAGVKTFTSALIASAGIQLGLLFNTNGSGASDVAIQAGTTLADASVNAGAKLLQVGTGIGGTFVEKFYITKAGGIVTGFISTLPGGWPTANSCTMSGGASLTMSGGGSSTGNVINLGDFTGDRGVIRNKLGASAASATTAAITLEHLNGALDAGDTLVAFRDNSVDLARVTATGRVDQNGLDRSATIGADTQNRPIGINTLASGATSVTITNSLVSTASHIEVTFHADPGGRVWVTKAAGSFTVNTSAAPGANAPFSWEVKGLI
jgi:hypothetical protein